MTSSSDALGQLLYLCAIGSVRFVGRRVRRRVGPHARRVVRITRFHQRGIVGLLLFALEARASDAGPHLDLFPPKLVDRLDVVLRLQCFTRASRAGPCFPAATSEANR